MSINKFLLISFLTFFGIFGVAGKSFAAPSISSVSGTVSHGQSVTIAGSGFGTKATAAPVAFGDMENDSTTARIGAWSDSNGYPDGRLAVSASNDYSRNDKSLHYAECNIDGWGTCAFTGGADSPSWFIQEWFYLGSDWSWGEGNNKIFRMWSTGSDLNNLRIQAPWQNVDIVVEAADVGHGGWGTGWQPVTSQYTCADQAFGHECTVDYWSIAPGSAQWRNFSSDMTSGSWHLFQWEYQSSDIDTANGVLRWWVDGKKVFDHSDITTRTASNPSHMRPMVVGIFTSSNLDATGHYYMDDVYIDNTWQRVEIGNSATYDSCTLKEIQPITSWSDTSAAVTVNQGSFADGSTGYVFVTDVAGTRNTGYQINFGNLDSAPPAAPVGLAVN